MSSAPKYSMVVLTCGRSELLAQCLRAIGSLEQPAPFEVLVVADGESAFAKVAPLPELKPHKLICSQGKGIGAARNTGWKHSRGGFVCYIADDYVLPKNYFGVAEDFFARHPDEQILTFNIAPKAKSYLANAQKTYFQMTLYQTIQDLSTGRYLHGDRLPVARAAILRKDLLERLGGFCEISGGGEDFQFSLRAGGSGVRVYFAHQTCVLHDERVSLRALVSQRIRYSRNYWQILRANQRSTAATFPTRKIVQEVFGRYRNWWRIAKKLENQGQFLLHSPVILLFLASYWSGVWVYSRRPASQLV